MKKSKFEGDTGRGGKFECVLCGFQGKDKYKLARHKRTHSKSLQKHPCDICQFSFRSLEAVRKHVAFYHDGPAKAENQHNSTSDVEIKVEDLEKNTLEENENPLGDAEEEEENVDEVHCDYCEKSFKTKKHLSRHQATHSGVIHNCPQCNSTFSRRDKLNAHIRKKHQTETGENKSRDHGVEAETDSANTNNEDQQIEDQQIGDQQIEDQQIEDQQIEDQQIEDQEVVDFEELLDE